MTSNAAKIPEVQKLEQLKNNRIYSEKEAKKFRNDIIFSLGVASLVALLGGVSVYRVATTKYRPERDLFISVGKYAENYQGENPKQVLDYLDQTLRNHIKDISFEPENTATTKEDKSKTLSNIISQTKTLEDLLWYSQLYQTIEDSAWDRMITDNPAKYPEANASVSFDLQEIRSRRDRKKIALQALEGEVLKEGIDWIGFI